MAGDHRVARESDVPEGSILRCEAGGLVLALVKKDGLLYALGDRCPHAGGPLSEGTMVEGMVRCPWHDRHFDPATGACTTHPATRPAVCHAVRVEDGAVIVTLSAED